MLKKLFLVSLFVFSLAFVSTAHASVNVAEELQSQINAILEQIKILQSRISAQSSVTTGGSTSGASSSGGGSVSSSPAIAFCYNFTRNLGVGDRGNDVDALVSILVKDGEISDTGENIRGEDFNELVAEAVIGFQSKYGIRKTGYVGPLTRAKLNALYSCGTPNQVSISILSPNGDDHWPIGSKQRVKMILKNIPSGSGIYFFLNSGNIAGFPILNVSNNEKEFEFVVPSSVIEGGDMVTMLDQ